MNRITFLVGYAVATCLLATFSPSRSDDWPQWRGPRRDGVWREDGILDRFPSGGPPVRWRTPIGAGFSGPAVAAGRVYVTDRVLDEQAPTDVKTRWDYRDKTDGHERVLCLDATTGEILWRHSWSCTYDAAYAFGPRATPTVEGSQVYALGMMGDLWRLDAATGRVVWHRNYLRDDRAEAPLYGFACAPLIDGDRLIVVGGGEGRLVMALDRETGREVWTAGSASAPGYCAPLIRTLAGRRQLIVWHGDGLTGFDPESGRELWFVAHRLSLGTAISTPAIEGNRIGLSSQHNGAMLLEFQPGQTTPAIVWTASAGSGPERRWKKAGFNTTMSTVLLLGDHMYGVSLYGETCCLEADTGRRVWTTLQPTSGGAEPRERWSTLFMVPQGDRVFAWNDHGDLILARLTPDGYHELDRAHVLDPDTPSAGGGGRLVVWSHPAFANRRMYARNNHEIVCVDLERSARSPKDSASEPGRSTSEASSNHPLPSPPRQIDQSRRVVPRGDAAGAHVTPLRRSGCPGCRNPA